MARTIDFGGKARTLAFDLEQVADGEDAIDYPVRSLIGNKRGLSINQLIAFLWASLRREEPGLTRNQVRDWLHAYLPPKGSGTFIALENAVIEEIIASGTVFVATPPAAETNGRPTPAPTASGISSSS